MSLEYFYNFKPLPFLYLSPTLIKNLKLDIIYYNYIDSKLCFTKKYKIISRFCSIIGKKINIFIQRKNKCFEKLRNISSDKSKKFCNLKGKFVRYVYRLIYLEGINEKYLNDLTLLHEIVQNQIYDEN